MLNYFKQQLNHADVQDDLLDIFVQNIKTKNEDDILDKYEDERLYDEQYEIED